MGTRTSGRSLERLTPQPVSPSAPMSVRRSTVEHPFGTIKAWTGPCHFLTRRLAGARTEMALTVLADTIKRMIAPVGVRGLMVAIPE
jgi:hypothetical protein